MRVDRILELADFVEGLPPEKFSMNTWAFYQNPPEGTPPAEQTQSPTPNELLHDCGTCACLGGWTETLFGDYPTTRLGMYLHFDDGREMNAQGFVKRARHLLDLPAHLASELFTPLTRSWGCITKEEAVATLRHLAETGEVQWNLPRQPAAT